MTTQSSTNPDLSKEIKEIKAKLDTATKKLKELGDSQTKIALLLQQIADKLKYSV